MIFFAGVCSAELQPTGLTCIESESENRYAVLLEVVMMLLR